METCPHSFLIQSLNLCLQSQQALIPVKAEPRFFTDHSDDFRFYLYFKSTLRKRAVSLLPSQLNAFFILIFFCEVSFPFAQELRKMSCHLRDVKETGFRDYSKWWWGFFVHSFSVYLEKNFLCIQLLRKNFRECFFRGFVNINSSALNLSKATRSQRSGFIKTALLYIQNQFYLNPHFFGASVVSFSPHELTEYFNTAYYHNLPARQQNICTFWFCSLVLKQFFLVCHDY